MTCYDISARVRIGHIDIRSLRQKTHEIKHLISKYNLHALAVSENLAGQLRF